MTIRRFISTSIRTASVISLLLLLTAAPASAQTKFFSMQKDSIPVFRGFAVSFDLVGAGMAMFGDRGQYEGALRVNLHDEWFPVVELGYGKANSEDEVTKVNYKTSAPYFKVGIDRNLLKDKHGANRLYGGLRYAFTSYKRTEIELENTFTLQVSKYISAQLFLYPRFDDSSVRDTDLGYWQFKEHSSIGFNYTF